MVCFKFERIREYFLAEVHNTTQSPGYMVDFNLWSSCVCHEAIKECHNETDNLSIKTSKSGLLMTVARELAGYNLELVCVQEVRWDVRVGDYTFFMEKEMKIMNWEQDFCTPQDSTSR